MNAVEKRKILYLCRESNINSPAVQPVTVPIELS
jgi:hypothetical protein